MNQIKIGKFISLKRKEKKLTQSELAEMLGITDRAISKWENGICLPDSGTMPELCKILGITINDLFNGEVTDMKNREKKLEENLLQILKVKEQRDKELLLAEIFIGVITTLNLIICIFAATFVNIQVWQRIALITVSIIQFAIGISYAIRIEQVAGYYECKNCHHKYVPTYKSVFFAPHINRTRKMICPECKKRTWHKKIITKNDETLS